MKTLQYSIAIEVPDDFTAHEALADFMFGSMQNLPDPEDIDASLIDVEIGLGVFDN